MIAVGDASVRIVLVLLACSLGACGSPPPPTVAPTTGSGAPCGLTPEESAAPIAPNASYVPSVPMPPASASAAP